MSVADSPAHVHRPRSDWQGGHDTGSAHGGVAAIPSWELWSRPLPSRRQQLNDLGLAAGLAVGAIISVVLINSMGAFIFGSAPGLTEQVVWALAITAPLAVRRRYPEVVLFLVAAVFLAGQMRQIGDNLFPSIALFIAIYTVGAWGRERIRARWTRIVVIVAMFAWLGYSIVDAIHEDSSAFDRAAGPLDPVVAAALYSVGFNLLFFLAPYFFGNVVWVSVRRRHELEVQSEQLRRSQAENARQAVVSERIRIARDLHDVVAHHVSVMGVQATAARRVLSTDYTLASQALEVIESTARGAVSELRGLLGVLRADPDDIDGQATGPVGAHVSSPGVEQVPQLVEETTRGAGLSVEHAVYGAPREVPGTVALSAYRVVQEALTNVVKHARANHVDVRVRYLERWLEIEVIDDGRGGVPSRSGPRTGGLGLVGMRERVAVHSGELEVGPRPAGGFVVRARFPLPPADGRTADAGAGAGAGSTPGTRAP
ncbi:sensor histidine kinase [Phytoactinopolyspora limicola]|uniref:sensor histidine kinase n=1 Tax=Phytoactinopolyspora limicola TaxID=2715536 RepID=UPI00140D3D25|nr:sensor histidine kinase [Phytoactinopolyspora limicola]